MRTISRLMLLVSLVCSAREAYALEPAPCESDPDAKPSWLGFEAGAGTLLGAEDGQTHWVLQADATYTFGLTTLKAVPSGPGELTACTFDVDAARDFVRLGVGYSVGLPTFNAASIDVSWLRVLSSSFSVNAGPAADLRWYGSDFALPVGLLLRVNYAEWVSLRGRVLYTALHDEALKPGVSAFLTLSIEPRLYCEHVSREKCGPTWFFEELLPF